ncbi:MAG: hypothetical protein ACQCN6_11995 [Candidatus Bathyarchaeia archaeon]
MTRWQISAIQWGKIAWQSGVEECVIDRFVPLGDMFPERMELLEGSFLKI